MASGDWAISSGSLATSSLKRGVSAGLAKPNGGGTFAYGFNSIVNTTGCTVLYVDAASFTPAAKGGYISAAIQRAPSSGKTGFAPFLAICIGGTGVTDKAYILGLGDADPSHIILRKGAMSDGVPDVVPGTQGVIRQSTSTYAAETYYHLKLEAVVNLNGDVVINCYQSDLTAHAVTSPTWTAITGMSQWIDDHLGVASQIAGIAVGDSLPYTSGNMGFGMRVANIGRRALFDHVQPAAQA
jgi:hypothetical protein